MDSIYVTPSFIIRSFFILSATGILAANALPDLRTRFVRYGSRAVPPSTPALPSETPTEHRTGGTDLTERLLDSFAKLQVPHSWFFHFYVVSVLSSGVWALQLGCNGAVFRRISAWESRDLSNSMTAEQVVLAWLMMLLQGARRLYESAASPSSSNSSMWCAHWLVGIAFYVAIGVAVWIEGTASITTLWTSSSSLKLTPSYKSTTALVLFVFASAFQHVCHAHLASLKKYSVPTSVVFSKIVCPHYFAECLIYLSLAAIAAPPGDALNKTLSSGLLFVAVNLGVTAQSTRQWYAAKFGESAVASKSKMIPFVF